MIEKRASLPGPHLLMAFLPFRIVCRIERWIARRRIGAGAPVAVGAAQVVCYPALPVARAGVRLLRNSRDSGGVTAAPLKMTIPAIAIAYQKKVFFCIVLPFCLARLIGASNVREVRKCALAAGRNAAAMVPTGC